MATNIGRAMAYSRRNISSLYSTTDDTGIPAGRQFSGFIRDAAGQLFFLSNLSSLRTLTPKYTTSATTTKSMSTLRKFPHMIFAAPIWTYALRRFSTLLRPSARMGLIMSCTSAATSFETAPPRINPTASPTTPCSRIKSMNPFMSVHLLSVRYRGTQQASPIQPYSRMADLSIGPGEWGMPCRVLRVDDVRCLCDELAYSRREPIEGHGDSCDNVLRIHRRLIRMYLGQEHLGTYAGDTTF